MKKEKAEVKNYTFEIQEMFLNFLVSDPSLFTRCQTIVRPEYWQERLRPAVRYVMKFADEFHTLPKPEQILAETKIPINLVSDISEQHATWFLSEIEQFCRHRAVEEVIMAGSDLVEAGQYADVESRLKEALTISLQTDLGTSYYEDPKARIQAVLDRQDVVSTGWNALDSRLYGGFTKGTLNIFAGGSGCVTAGTKITMINLPHIATLPNVRLSNHDAFKFDYVRQFYTVEQIDSFCSTGEQVALLNYLFAKTQPLTVNIEDLHEINNGDHVVVASMDGWVKVDQWRNKGTKPTFSIVLSDGRSITASDDHLFQKANGEWVFLRDLRLGDYLMTTTGSAFIVMHKAAGDQVVYDLAIDHANHRYFTNGISSHNSGKSLFLQNLALNWSFMGYDVVYISLELSENLVAARLDSMVTGFNTKEIYKKIEDVNLRVKMQGKKSGSITIKKMPEAGTTSNLIRAYLKEYEIQNGKKPGAILCDYLDLMYPNNAKINPSDMFVKDKFVSEELRALASEYHVLFATASQLNRGAVQANGTFDHSHIAGGISKINTADNVFGIHTTPAMKERGEYQLQFLKTRSSASVGMSIDLAFDQNTLRISDVDENAQLTAPKTATQVSADLKKMIASPGKTFTAKIPDMSGGEIQTPTNTLPSNVPSPMQAANQETKAKAAEHRAKMMDMVKNIRGR